MDSGSLVSLVNPELRSLVRIWCCSKRAINNFLPVWKGSDVQVGVSNKGDPVHEYVVQEVRSTSTASGVLSYSDTVRAPFDIQLCIKIIGIDQSFPSFWCTGIGFGSNWLCDRYRACGSLWHAPGYNLVLLLCCFGFQGFCQTVCIKQVHGKGIGDGMEKTAETDDQESGSSNASLLPEMSDAESAAFTVRGHEQDDTEEEDDASSAKAKRARLN